MWRTDKVLRVHLPWCCQRSPSPSTPQPIASSPTRPRLTAGCTLETPTMMTYGPSRVSFCSFSSSSGSVSCKGTITIETLQDVAAGNTYKINNYLDDEYKPRRTDVIMGDVDKMRGRTITYDLLGRNCEHFVTFLRYGKSKSQQADDFLNNVLTGTAGLLGVLTAVAASTAAAASTLSK
uniref:Phospholipase A and acyltransferase 4-like n=1 Tax=Oncorhynchus kisutch TaxID=8019 RepID=A0A8C7IQI3_ONCKI